MSSGEEDMQSSLSASSSTEELEGLYTQQPSRPQFKGTRKRRPKKQQHTKDDVSFGAFEKHTKGIGMKLLMKMGYKPGEGLGASGEGRIEPIAVAVRKDKAGIGADTHDLLQPGKAGFDKAKEGATQDSSEEEYMSFVEERQREWRKVSPQFEVIRQQEQLGKVNIIDMTGQKKPFSGRFADLRQRLQQAEQKQEQQAISEQQRKALLDMQVIRAEQSFISIEGQLRAARARLDALLVPTRSSLMLLPMDAQLAILARRIASFDSIEPEDVKGLECCERLLRFFWIPRFREAMLADFASDRWPSELLKWLSVLPPDLLRALFQTVVAPRLREQPELIRPWLPIVFHIDDTVSVLAYRRYLARMLSRWQPPDAPPVNLLKEARQCLPDDHFTLLLRQSIIPTLRHFLDASFTVDARAQDLSVLNAVLPWRRQVDLTLLISSCVVTKLHRYLQHWLTAQPSLTHATTDNSTGMAYEQIGQWYRGWRILLGDFFEEPAWRPLLDSINEHLNKAHLR